MKKGSFIFQMLFLIYPLALRADPSDGGAAPVRAPKPVQPTVVKMVLQDLSSKSQPMTLYRSGLKYSRHEMTGPKPGNGHRVIVCSEPDLWDIDMDDKTAKHMVDPDGEKGEMHMPIWMDTSVPEPLKGLEFGTEFDFLTANKVPLADTQTIQGTVCDQYVFKGGDYTMKLWSKKGTRIPVQVEVYQGSKRLVANSYLFYESNLPFDKSLFELPSGIRIVEAPVTESKINWKEFKPENGRFAVLLPEEGQVDPTDKTLWSAQDPMGRSYIMSYADVTQKDVKPEDFFGAALEIALKNINGQLVDQNIFQYKGFTAGDFKILAGKNVVGMVRMVMVNQRVYSLEYWATTEVFNAEPMHKFFDSLRIFDPDKDKIK